MPGDERLENKKPREQEAQRARIPELLAVAMFGGRVGRAGFHLGAFFFRVSLEEHRLFFKPFLACVSNVIGRMADVHSEPV